MHPSSRIDWILFALLGFFWGSSFIFIKIGVDAGLEPFTLVALRLFFGALLLVAVVAAAREALPGVGRIYGHLLVMSVFSVALPFTLITWAEQSVDSTIAAVLNGAVPLFVIPIAAVFLHDEPITPARLAGLAIGFIGVAILVGFDPADVAGGDLTAEMALLAATASYAIGGVYARRNVRGLRPMIPALFQVGFGLAIVAVLALIFERPLATAYAPEALFAVVWLGLLGSGMAYLVFFRLLDHWGATRTSMVAYLLPVYGIVLGALVLNEPVGPSLLIGTALVIGGIALVSSRYGTRAIGRHGFARPPAAPASPSDRTSNAPEASD